MPTLRNQEMTWTSAITVKKRGDKKCKKKIYVYEMDCYKQASEEQIEKMTYPSGPVF